MSKEFQGYLTSGGPIPPKVQQAFFDVDPDPEVRAVLSAALDAKAISADDALVAYISKEMTDDQLWAISIALRNGANPNMYVQSDRVKAPVHILVYVYVVWHDPKRHPPDVSNAKLVLFSLVLLALGANPTLPAIDPLGGAVQSVAARTRSRNVTVMEWLDRNKFAHVLARAYPDLVPVVSKRTLKKVAILSGHLGLLEGITLEEADTDLILKSRANDVRYSGRLEYKAYRLPGSQPAEDLPGLDAYGRTERVPTSSSPAASSSSREDTASSLTLGRGDEDLLSASPLRPGSIPLDLQDGRPNEPQAGLEADEDEDAAETFDVTSLLPPPHSFSGLDYEVIWNAILFCNQGMIAFYASRGIFMSYPLTNTVILRIRQYQRQGQPILQNIFLSMLVTSIEAGLPIDSEQRTLLTALPGEIYQQIAESYARPYWLKECGHQNIFNDRVSDRLHKLANEIGLEPQDHSSICYQLQAMSDMAPEELKAAARTRQQARLSADHGTFAEFSGDRGPALVCSNADDFDGDPFDTADLNWGHYRDIRGDVWCYISPQFDDLASSKVNPVTNQPLPDSFLAQMAYKQGRLRQLGRDPKVSRKFSELIDEITREDKFSSAESDHQLDLFEDFVANWGVTRVQLGRLTAKDFDAVVATNGYPANLGHLTANHALLTTAYIVNGLRIRDPTRAKTIASQLAARIQRPVSLPPGARQAQAQLGPPRAGIRPGYTSYSTSASPSAGPRYMGPARSSGVQARYPLPPR